MNNYKAYKSKRPEDTINTVRSFLHSIGITLNEQSRNSESFYSCRLSICESNISNFNIGTNGKGKNYIYALASGYGEFMERLQNHLLFDIGILTEAKHIIDNKIPCPLLRQIKKQKIRIDFLYDPNEKIANVERCLDDLNKYGIHLFDKDEQLNQQISNLVLKGREKSSVIMVPFYDIHSKQIQFLPMDFCLLMSGSNGMCAGNTYEEAFLQGMCEIFERYSMKEIFFKQICPPRIDIDYFIGTDVWERYHSLTNSGYKITILDCSLGKGLPVIGAIIQNSVDGKYMVKFGSDFVPSIALERCLTESFQSTFGFNGISNKSSWADEDNTKFNLYRQFDNIISNGSGVWPSSLFSNNSSYTFSSFPSNYGQSDSTDIKTAIRLVHNLGFHLFVRDNTASDIPALFLYAPGMSSTYANLEHFTFSKKPLEWEWYGKFGCLSNISQEEKRCLLESVSNIKRESLFDIDLKSFAKYNQSCDLQYLDIIQLLMMLSYESLDYDKTIEYLHLLSQINSPDALYFSVATKYVYLRTKGLTDSHIYDSLITIFSEEVVTEVINDFSNPDRIFCNHTLSCDLEKVPETQLNGIMYVLKCKMKLNDLYKAFPRTKFLPM